MKGLKALRLHYLASSVTELITIYCVVYILLNS